MSDLKLVKPMELKDGKICFKISDRYYSRGSLYDNGSVSVIYHFQYGAIEIIDGKVIGGEVVYKDDNSVIEVRIFNGTLSLFRPSTQLNQGKQYETDTVLFTVPLRFNKSKIESTLNKTYKGERHVDEFMRLARDIFYSKDIDDEFDLHGDYIEKELRKERLWKKKKF